MSNDIITDQGPIHKNTHNTETPVSVFVDYPADRCRVAPDGKHDWNGPWVQTWDGEGSTCLHCGLDFGTFAMRCLP